MNEFNKESIHCNTKWCSDDANKNKFGCETGPLTVADNTWQQNKLLKAATTKDKAVHLLHLDETEEHKARKELKESKLNIKKDCSSSAEKNTSKC